MKGKYRTESTTVRRKLPSGEWEEIETTKIHKINVKADDEFYMVYLKHTSPFFGLTSADDIKILAKLCEWAEFDKGVVYLTTNRRLELCAVLKMHNSNVSKSLARLKENKHISGKRGEFAINPTIFWKGSRSARVDILKNEGIQVMFDFQIDQPVLSINNKPTAGIKPNEEY